jgi:cephalosporin-C deacetylase
METLEQIHSEPKWPSDFEEFWRRTQEALADTPLEWERVPDELATTTHLTVDWIKFPSLHGLTVYGWLAAPKETLYSGNRGFLWLPGYSLGNPPPGPESLYSNMITMGLNLHGNLPNTPYVHPFEQGKEYITQGIESPETYIYRAIICHCLRALDVLAAQAEVDPERVIVGGMSQGGGLALVTAALAHDRVALCLADMPWLCDLDRALALIDRSKYKNGRRIPDGRALIEDYAKARPEMYEKIYRTYRYFDPLSHAAEITCPTQMSAGGRDPSCRPPTIFAVYNALTASKEMLYLPNTGHEIVPAMHKAHEKWVNQWL